MPFELLPPAPGYSGVNRQPLRWNGDTKVLDMREPCALVLTNSSSDAMRCTFPTHTIAAFYADIGEVDLAFEWLEVGYRETRLGNAQAEDLPNVLGAPV